MSDPEVIAYAYKVKGPYSGEFTLRVDFDDPRETWRDDHEIRDVVELANIKEIEGETLTQYADAESIAQNTTSYE